MSITGSLLTYENNNHIVNKSKKRTSNIYTSSNLSTSVLSTTANSMGKITPPSLNSSISKTESSANHKQQQQQAAAHPYFKAPHLPVKCMNSKRKHAKYNNMYTQMYPDHNNYLHLNSLWSIWYGVLLTLFQGYLAVHGAYRFLGCSLIPWKMEPVAELNLQIVLSGLVFVLLPFFFTSAVFKVGNMANDGNKLGNSAKERLCSMAPHDGLEEESRGGTLRTLWTHGGPTAAFIHILIAMCLLLPRLLLEGRIIENGLLPKETIWQTELDFVTVNRRSLVVSSIKASSYQNNTSIESQEDENYFNDTIFSSHSNNYKNTTNLLDNSFEESKHSPPVTLDRNLNFLEFSDLADATLKQYKNDSNKAVTKYATNVITTASPSISSTLKYEPANTINTTKMADFPTTSWLSSTAVAVDKSDASTNRYEDLETKTSEKPLKIAQNDSDEIISFSSPAPASLHPKHFSHNPHHRTQQHHGHGQHHHNGKAIRKHHRQRKIVSPSQQRKNHQQYSPHQKSMKSPKRLKDNYNGFSDYSIDLSNPDEFNFPLASEGFNSGGNVYEHRPTSLEALDYGHARVAIYPKSSTTISTTTRDSNIHIVKPEKLPEIIPSTPLSSNSKIIEIKQKANKIIKKREISLADANQVEIEPEYLVGEFSVNDSSEYIAEISPMESSTSSDVQSEYDAGRLDGFAGMLQLFFGVEKPIDVQTFSSPPSAEFVNLLFALLVWSVRYPAVFWTTAKSFATVFSVQMIASAADIIFSYVGISSLFKLQIYSQGQPIHNPGLILNASVTLSLFLLSVILILSSSMVLYLYGHGRLSAKMRDRSIISLSSNESWIYFAHCASLCYVLALCVVKAPLLNDLSATYRNSLHCPTFMAALVSVMHILLWIIIWMSLTVKRKWSFKLPPLDAYAVIGKATTQPLLLHNRGSLTNPTAAGLNNSTSLGVNNSSACENTDHKLQLGNSGNLLSNTSSSTDVLNDGPAEDIYWPKLAPNSPKLKVTFNEVTSTSDDDQHHRQMGEHEQNDGKRNSPRGTALCFTSIEGEIDDGEYATLRSGTANIVGIHLVGGSSETENNVAFSKAHILATVGGGGGKVLHLSEYDELPPPPPPNMTSSMTITNHTTTVNVNPRNTYVNCLDDSAGKAFGDDNISEEGKLLECVRDDSVTYASTRDLEPPLPPPPPKTIITTNSNGAAILQHRNSRHITDCMQLSSSPDYLISPLAPVRIAVHTNEAHIAPSSTPRCLRRADSGVPQEALTPRSDTESTISPPERAPSESSSGVHSAEEREVEVVIRPRVAIKPLAKLAPPAIQEEPNGRSTNMRMSSFAGGGNTASSATLPLQRSNAEQKFDYSQHCSTMPLPINSSHNHNDQQTQSAVYATSAHCMSQTQCTVSNLSSFKMPLYANSGVAMSGHSQTQLHDQAVYGVQARRPVPPAPPQPLTHTTLPNGVRYSNPNILRRNPYIKQAADLSPQYCHQTFSKIGYENSIINSTIHEDRDSANYSMVSDQESLYATANPLH